MSEHPKKDSDEPETRPSGVREPPGADPGDRTEDPDPHHALNNPAADPDPTEWPDPYERRRDPRDPVHGDPLREDAPHTPTGSLSTSEPHPSQDPEAPDWEGPKRDKVDR